MNPIPLELLAPARNADIGIEAIRHGADAVYIGASHFGARAAAGNSVDDIARLVSYAHQFAAKIYVTLNTLLHPDEMDAVRALTEQLLEVGVDAFIVQDLALLDTLSELARRRPELMRSGLLHASTQMDNRTPEHVRWLQQHGFVQVVLARELSLGEVRTIHQACPDVRIEAFVHGALCVSLSGRCFASEVIFQRSANRGECAQVCRMEFDLENERGDALLRNKHLLSLKDLCQIDALEEMADAGVRSFKIEGRLKNMSYVKNVTAAYNEALNALCAKHPDRYCRASRGEVELRFRPDVRKSFNRGFTHYFLYGRNPDIFSFDTPKAVGEPVGKIADVLHDHLVVHSQVQLTNGDGLCFFTKSGKLVGMRANRVEGNCVYPLVSADRSKGLGDMLYNARRGMTLYRNYDKQFEDTLLHDSAVRSLPVDVTIDYDGQSFCLDMSDGLNVSSIKKTFSPQLAHSHQRENIELQMSKLGNTPYRLRSLNLLYSKNYFIPSSMLTQWRRELVAQLTALTFSRSEDDSQALPMTACVPETESAVIPEDQSDYPLMTCYHCIRYAMGWCHKRQNPSLADVPRQLFLRLANGVRFRVDFDCRRCVMLISES